ncbi:hypothetical protein [Clostridium uliginosum]|uniref:Uncharacterized protein n=1 Tax=Clostridium uliginosum TaxID=119641 RepID=A0A1I1GRQ2_9CLOT|nr:hypothetical protein [Clostridium uliginosum]SFC14166.1 hypothetical protein SAMN05421842_10135 [Clostridium uliginosum]
MCELAVKIKRNQFSINLIKDLNYIPNKGADTKESILNLFNAISVAGKTLIEAIGDAHYIVDESKNIVKVYKCKISNKVNPSKPFSSVLTKKQVDFDDFSSFIVWNGIECEEELCFMTAKDYKSREFKNAIYATSEDDIWNALEATIEMDYDTMEKEFEGVRFRDNENTCVVKFNNEKEYAILRM